jgi:hypothetical protein
MGTPCSTKGTNTSLHIVQFRGSTWKSVRIIPNLRKSHCVDIVTYSGFSIHDGTLFHSKSQYTTVKHSQQLLEHTYTSDPHGL